MADYVRLVLGYPCWERRFNINDSWDAGYSTTAFFLAWIEKERIPSMSSFAVVLNAALATEKWSLQMFERHCGIGLDAVWWEYQSFLAPRDKRLIPPPDRYSIATRLGANRVFFIRNKHTDGIITVENGQDPKELLWRLVPSGSPSEYIITHVSSSKVLDVKHHSHENGSELLAYTENGGQNQKWRFVQKAHFADEGLSGGYVLRAGHSGKALDATADGRITQWDCNGQLNQEWGLEAGGDAIEDGEYILTSKRHLKNLGVDATKRLVLESLDRHAALWTLTVTDGVYAIGHGGLVLDVPGSSRERVGLVLREASGGATQQWRITAVEGGHVIESVHSGRVLEFSAALVQGEENATAEQVWLLSRVNKSE